MLVAREKRRENMAEYILYMWQVEDTIRAFSFDMERLDRDLISQYDQPGNIRKEIREWYENIAAHMKNEKVERTGHTAFIKGFVNELNSFHLHLLQQPSEAGYMEVYLRTVPLIREMNAKQDWTSENEVEVCLNAVYIYMMMRLKKEKLSKASVDGIEKFIGLLALLSARYRDYEENGPGLKSISNET